MTIIFVLRVAFVNRTKSNILQHELTTAMQYQLTLVIWYKHNKKFSKDVGKVLRGLSH